MKKDFVDTNEELRFANVVRVESGGTRTLYVSGQTGESGDLKSQSIGAFTNLKNRLAAAGAKTTDIVKMTTYVVDYSPEKARDAFAGAGLVLTDAKQPPAATLVGVQSLFSPGILIEVEAVAVIDA